MSGTAPQVEWYIARDGAQHGPISDVEMRKFVELGHLRATDLVWCARFTDWLPGVQAFPARINPAPVAPPAERQATKPAPSPAVVPQPGLATQPTPHDADWAAAMRAAIQADKPARTPAFEMAPGAAPSSNPNRRPAAAPDSHRFEPVAAPHMQGPASFGHEPAGTALQGSDIPADDDADDLPPRRGWTGRIAATVAVLLILGGLGWLGWQNRSLISGASAIGGIISAKMSNATPAEMFRASPYEAPGGARDLIDASLQKSAVWRGLKRDFADWYDERLSDVERMRTQKNDEKVISKFLADVIVTLRRRNAQAALQASPDHLKRMAGAFLGNLKQLAVRDGQTCFGFITFGEAHPFMQELSRTPAFAEALQRQLVAVFDAIADGRTNRAIHAATRRADYDVLTQELTVRGWTQQDLATFSDPQRLSKSSPEKVCSLVQDWFTTQLALKDAELQTRLLAESLKPLVGG